VKFKNIQFILDDESYNKVIERKGSKTWAQFVLDIDVIELDGSIRRIKKEI